MAYTVDTAKITQWAAEAKHAFGQTSSYLRDSVRVRRENALTMSWHKIGTGTATLDLAAHTDLTSMDPTHSVVSMTMGTIHSAIQFRDLDQAMTNLDLKREYTQEVARATNLALDTKIKTALHATGNTVTAAALTAANIISIGKQLNSNNVPMGDRTLVISNGGLEDILNDSKLTSRDYVEDKLLTTGFAKNVLGFDIILVPDTLLTAGSSTRWCYAYHKSAVGLGFSQDYTFDVERLPKSDEWQIMAKMAAGAVIIDDAGVCKFEVAD
jgi:hypothetical protein